MTLFWLKIKARINSCKVEHLFRGENHVGVQNLHDKHEIWLSKYGWRRYSEMRFPWLPRRSMTSSSKIGIGATLETAIEDAQPQLQQAGIV